MLLVFDGDCGFCTRSARWIEARVPDGRVVVRPGQALDLAEVGLTADDVERAAWLIDDDGRRHRGHAAVARSLQAIGGFWRLAGSVMRVPPVSWLARAVYALVAQNRHRLPGATDACRLDT